MNTITQQISNFLFSCGGNWRNTLFIRDSAPGGGYLMTADRDGMPLLMEVSAFNQLTGGSLDTAECCGELALSAFETVYAKYLLWRCPSAQEHSLRSICVQNHERGDEAQ